MTLLELFGMTGEYYSVIQQSARMAFAGILAFVIAYQVSLSRARPKEALLKLSAAWAVAALLMVLGRAVQHATGDHATVLLGARIFHSGVLALVPLGIAMGHQIRRVPRGRLFWIVILGTSAPIPLIWTSHLVIGDRVRVFETLAGPILGPVPAAIAPAALPYLAVITLYLIYILRRGERPRSWRQRLPHDLGIWLLLPALLNDVLLYSGAFVTLELSNVALFVQVMAMNVGILAGADQAFSGLEEAVEARTAELASRERSLSLALETRRRILDAAPDAVCLLDDGRFEYVNCAGVRFFGRPQSELEGMRFSAFVLGSQVQESEQYLTQIAGAASPVRPVELRFRGSADQERVAEVAGVALDLDGVPRTMVTLRDTSERHQLLAKLQVADRLASMGTLAAGIAHEINNPLAFLSMNLELIRDTVGDLKPVLSNERAAELDGYVDDCLNGTDRIAQIVKDLGTFTRGESALTEVDCRETLEYALRITGATIRHRASIERDFQSIPPVVGDPRRLSQVFLNLIVNAFQAIPEGEEPQVIRVATHSRADGWIVVEISDTGSGVPPELLPTVFDPFVTSKSAGTGTGLGLFICQRIVTELGGEIRLSPRLPNGTMVQVTLPPAPARAASPELLPAAAVRLGAGRTNLRVLIADDEPLVLHGLTRLLAHHTVTAVSGGADAIREIEQGEFDVVLCDLMMPDVTGADVWRKAKERGADRRFVLMTAGATSHSLQHFVEDSGVACLLKPASLAQIESAIEQCVQVGQLRV